MLFGIVFGCLMYQTNEILVSKETMVLLRWESETLKFGIKPVYMGQIFQCEKMTKLTSSS